LERKNETIVVTTRLPKSIHKELDKMVDSSRYMSKSDFVRIAIREKLKGEDGG